MPETNCHILWSCFKKGDSKVREALYRTYINSLVNSGFKITANPDLVKDCIQDLFVELWKSREQLSDTANPKFYLFRALRNKSSRALAQQSYVSEAEVQLCSDDLLTGYIELVMAANEVHKGQWA